MRPLKEIFAAYATTRSRVCELVSAATSEELSRTVPACPAWRVQDLAQHLVSMPVALAGGRLPEGNISEWIEAIIAERNAVPFEAGAWAADWTADDDGIAALLNGPAGLLFDDLAVHEHDLRGALDRPDHQALEAPDALPRALQALGARVSEAGLGAIEVVDPGAADGGCWRSHDAPAGWTIRAEPWEAFRALSSRRTAVELAALPADGSAAAYIRILDDHLPLPAQSLGE